MGKSHIDELKQRMSSLSDGEILKVVNVEYDQYREEAIAIAKEELTKRNLQSKIEDKWPDISPKEKSTTGMVLGWVFKLFLTLVCWGIALLFLQMLRPMATELLNAFLSYRTASLIWGSFSAVLILVLLYSIWKK